jgi:hypothetical protein
MRNLVIQKEYAENEPQERQRRAADAHNLVEVKTMWFSATGLFIHRFPVPGCVTQFEERVVIVEAENEDHAERLILAEFSEYASDDAGIELLDEYYLQEIEQPHGSKVVEVASTMRVSPLEPQEYIDRYWCDLRPDSCDQVGWNHAWFNVDNESSRCYNCLEVRPGKPWKQQKL